MTVDERCQRSQILFLHLLKLLRFCQDALDQQGVHVNIVMEQIAGI
jgi:hypothetical protein